MKKHEKREKWKRKGRNEVEIEREEIRMKKNLWRENKGKRQTKIGRDQETNN